VRPGGGAAGAAARRRRGVLQWNRSDSVLVYAPPEYNDAWRLFRFIGSLQDTSMFGPAPAYAFTEDGATHELASLYMSDEFTWIDGSQDIIGGFADTQTIVVHEMGHLAGLNHPEPGGAPTARRPRRPSRTPS
jgi:hypothetical protein